MSLTEAEEPVSPPRRPSLALVAFASAILLLALLGLVGWVSGPVALGSFGTDWQPMAPSTALLLLILGSSLLIRGLAPASRWSRWVLVGASALIAGIGACASFSFSQTGSFWLDRLLIPDPARVDGRLIGHMSPLTAGALTLLGLAILARPSRPGSRWLTHVSGLLATAILAVAVVVCLGYLYATPLLYFRGIVPVALPTGLAFLAASAAAVSLAGPEALPFRGFHGDSVQAMLLRAFVPTAVAAVAVHGVAYRLAYDHIANLNPALLSAMSALVLAAAVALLSTQTARVVGRRLDEAQERRLEALEHLRQAEARYHGALDTLMEGCLIIGPDWRYLYVNPTAAAQGRRTVGELVGHTMEEAFPGIEETGIFAALRTSMVDRVTQRLESGFAFPDGSTVTFDLSIHPIPEGVFALTMDVTERKRSEEAVALLNRELAAQVQELAQANEEMEAFLYSVSHDLAAPLVSVEGMAGMLVRDCGGQLGPEGLRRLERIRVNVERLQGLLNDLLELSRVGRMDTTTTAADLSRVTQEVLELLEGEIAAAGAQVVVAGAPGLPVQANARRLTQVMQNLIGNAVKYGRGASGPRIEVGWADRGDMVEVWVSDHGPGIPPEHQERIFRPFHRLAAAAGTAGTGMGLAIVKKAVEFHGGKVWVESRPGAGTTFCFTLPKAGRT
jgi:signal transduction histidine kinase